MREALDAEALGEAPPFRERKVRVASPTPPNAAIAGDSLNTPHVLIIRAQFQGRSLYPPTSSDPPHTPVVDMNFAVSVGLALGSRLLSKVCDLQADSRTRNAHVYRSPSQRSLNAP